MTPQNPSPATPARTPVRRDIQGLRALAVVAVVLTHVIGWPRGGFAGVDVFFVVSGFLITGLLLREVAETGRISLRDFFARRVRRILPAATVVLVVVVVAAFFVFNSTRADRTLGDAIAAFALVSNWRFAAEGTDYFQMGAAVSPLQHFWSLSVEEQFYLVWPGLLVLLVLCIPLAARRSGAARGVVFGAALVVVVASATWAGVQTAAEPTVAYFSTAARAWELGVGALLAAATPALRRLPAVIRGALGWVGLAGVVWSFFVLDPDTMPFPAPWAALPVAAAALVIAGGVGGDPGQRHLFPLSNPASVFVGDLSYSLYLWHFPVIVFAAVVVPASVDSTPLVLLTIAVLTVSMYFLVEQPLHRSPWLRRRVSRVDAEEAARPSPPEESAPRSVTPGSLSTRPEAWSPGTRYYPGSRPRPVVEPRREIVDTLAVVREPVSVSAEPGPSEEEPSSTAPWAAWRARYRPQFALAAATLGIGAGVVGLVAMVTFGSPILVPSEQAAAGAAEVPIEDPTAAVQAELAAAASASTWPDLHPSLNEVMRRSSDANPAHDCFLPDRAPDPARCTWGDARAARHMYVVGDSSAMAYAPAFKKMAEDSGGAWRITTVGLYGCRFTDVLVQNDGAGIMAACPQRKADVGALIAADPADLVVVSNAYTLAHTVNGRSLSADDLAAATQAQMSTYGAAGHTVYLAPPPAGGDLSRCYSPVSGPAACLTSVDSTWHEMARAAESVAAASGDHTIDSLLFSCWEDRCPAFAANIPVRYDQVHLTVAYAERIMPVLRWDLDSLGRYAPPPVP